MTQRRIRELLSKEGPRIRKRFLAVMQRVKDDHAISELETALSEGRIAEYLDSVEKAAGAFASRTEALRTVVGHETADFLSQHVDKLVSYDASNPAAVDLIRTNRARLVGGITESQRGAIVDILAAGTAEGINPRQMAVKIRDVIGLTRKQAARVTAFRDRLEAKEMTPLNADAPEGEDAPPRPKAPTAAQIDKRVAAFAQRQLNARAEDIARTEAKSAVDETLHNTFQQAIDAGNVNAEQIECKWLAGDPPRTRAWHASMDGQTRPWGELFTSGLGNSLRFPGDPNAPAKERRKCRCGIARRILPAGKKPASVDPVPPQGTPGSRAAAQMAAEPMITDLHPAFTAVVATPADLDEFHGAVAAHGFGSPRKPLTVAEMTQALAPPPGYTAKVARVIASNEDAGVPAIEVTYHDSEGRQVASTTREFRPDGEIHHAIFTVDDDAQQGAGFGSTVNGQALLRYEKWGAKKVTLDAAWVGRYAWAKAGFTAQDTAPMIEAADAFIDEKVPEAKRADYKAKVRKLAATPWKLAAWSDGADYDAFFSDGSRQQRGTYALGKALLLDHRMPIWAGELPIDPTDPGYLQALEALRVSERQ
jgi:hypothetical protein